MRIILFLIQKEFIQIFRNKVMLPMIFLVPIIQLVILVNAATLEMKKIDMTVVDKDLSSTSRNLIAKFQASPFYHIQNMCFDIKAAENDLKSDKSEIILHIKSGFEKKKCHYP